MLILLVILVFGGVILYGDFRAVGSRIANFPLPYLLIALALAALNYVIRFFRWAYYLRLLRVDIPLPANGLIFLAGLAMSVTPGKVGELLKSYLLRKQAGAPISVTTPAVLMERITDLIAVILLAGSGLALLPGRLAMAMLAIIGFLIIFGGLVLSRHGERLLSLPFIRRWREDIIDSRAAFRTLASPRALLAGMMLSLLAWLSEGVALWVILGAMDSQASLNGSVAIYSMSTLIGALSTLPGGLVGTEASMLALLQQTGANKGDASAATLLVRLVTLWFAVGLGVMALLILSRQRGRSRTAETQDDGNSFEPDPGG